MLEAGLVRGYQVSIERPLLLLLGLIRDGHEKIWIFGSHFFWSIEIYYWTYPELKNAPTEKVDRKSCQKSRVFDHGMRDRKVCEEFLRKIRWISETRTFRLLKTEKSKSSGYCLMPSLILQKLLMW